MPPEHAGLPGLQKLDREHLEFLLAASAEFNSTLELDELLPRVLETTVDLMGAEAGSLWMLEDGTLRCDTAVGPVADQLEGLEIPLGAGIVGAVVASQESEILTSPQEDPRFLHQIDEATGFTTRGMLAVPLVDKGKVHGAVKIVNKRSGQFDEEDLLFLQALEDDAAAAISNARLLQAERRAHDLASLLEVSHEITSTFDLDRVLISVVNLAGKAVPFDRCILAVEDESGFRVRAISGEDEVDRKSAHVRKIENLLLWAYDQKRELYVPDLREGQGEAAIRIRESFPDYVEESGARGILIVPVSDAESAMGLLLFEFPEPDYLEPWNRKAAELLANEAALAIRNAQLYEDVPFISWLEPLRERRQKLARLPGSTWVRWGAAAAVVLLIMTLVRIPMWVSAEEASLRAAVQTPARAGIAGIVETVWVREGEGVTRGAPVAELRNEELLRRIRRTEAELDMAERQALAADARGESGEAALARVRTAELEDALSLLRQEATRSRIVAPAAGVVLTPRMDERVGDWLQAGQPVAGVGDPDWMEVELQLSQADVGTVSMGDPVRAKVAAHPSVIFEGQVVEVAARAQGTPGEDPLYTVRGVLDNREGLLRPGMSASAKVVTRPRPLGSIIFRAPWRWARMNLWW